MLRALGLVVLAACGRVGFDSAHDASDSDGGLRPLHEYPLHSDYADLYGGPSLVPYGGSFVGNRYQFGPRQGLSLDNGMPADVYTLDMQLSFDNLDGWNKIVDFDNLGPDTGLYTYKTALQYVIVPSMDFITTEPRWAVGTPRRLTTTRDAAGTVTGYIDGVITFGARGTDPDPPLAGPLAPFTFVDSTQVAALSTDRVYFFVDDAGTGGDEVSSGTVERIRIFDVALTAQQVAEL